MPSKGAGRELVISKATVYRVDPGSGRPVSLGRGTVRLEGGALMPCQRLCRAAIAGGSPGCSNHGAPARLARIDLNRLGLKQLVHQEVDQLAIRQNPVPQCQCVPLDG